MRVPFDEEFPYVAEQVDRLIWWFLPRYAGGFAADSESYISVTADGQVRRGPSAFGQANGTIVAELQLSSQDFFIKAIELYCECDSEELMRDVVYHMAGAVTFALVSEAMRRETGKGAQGGVALAPAEKGVQENAMISESEAGDRARAFVNGLGRVSPCVPTGPVYAHDPAEYFFFRLDRGRPRVGGDEIIAVRKSDGKVSDCGMVGE